MATGGTLLSRLMSKFYLLAVVMVNISERPRGSEAVVRFICLSNIVISILITAVKKKL